jgi:hypothetical protein
VPVDAKPNERISCFREVANFARHLNARCHVGSSVNVTCSRAAVQRAALRRELDPPLDLSRHNCTQILWKYYQNGLQLHVTSPRHRWMSAQLAARTCNTRPWRDFCGGPGSIKKKPKPPSRQRASSISFQLAYFLSLFGPARPRFPDIDACGQTVSVGSCGARAAVL